MVKRIHLAACIAAAGLFFGIGAWAAEDHSHDGGTLAELTLDQGAKWQTDTPLRRGMDGIRDDLAAALPQIHDGKLAAEGYRRLAEKVHGHVNFMVENCKLTPEADAQLHLVLAQVMDGADTMADGHDRMAGAVAVVQALEAYGSHFQHPGWTSPRH